MQSNIKELYRSTLKKYRKYKIRYDRNLTSGRFQELSQRRQTEIVERLKKLYYRLKELKIQFKLAVASGATSLALSTSPVQSQQLGPFVENEEANLIRSTRIIGSNKKLTFADLDADGDLDMAMGIQAGTISYYENIGSSSYPRYASRTASDNPFDGISVSSNAAPQLIDFDGDGDMDMILGEFQGYFGTGISYYHNNDVEDDGVLGNSPSFTKITSPGSPIDGVSASKYDVKPVAVDIDGDGDLDIFLGQNGGFPTYESIIFYENNAGFSKQSLPAGLSDFSLDFGSSNTTPTFFDYDGDGDYDLFIGTFNGTVRYFKNTDIDPSDPGDTTIGDDVAFTEQVGGSNPLNGVNALSNSVITFADLDTDGDHDTIIGNNLASETPEYHENTSPGFVKRTGLNNPFDAFDVNGDASPTFVDIDGDGDMDAVIGTKYESTIYFLENNGDILVDVTLDGTVFDGLSLGYANSLAFANVDADADIDLFIGFSSNPAVTFYRNTGTEMSPSFNNEGNPLGISPVGGADSSPTLGDLNNDGIQDAFVGFGSQGQIRYFEGQSNAPTFTELTGSANPLGSFSVGTIGNARFAKPDLVDLDHDGDLDLAVGVHGGSSEAADGTVVFLENDGSANFTEMTGIANPFDGIVAGSGGDSEPTFVDIDKDGDLDMFVGNNGGKVQFFENQNLPPQLNSNTLTSSYTEDASPEMFGVDITLSDDGNDNIIGATIFIINNLVSSEDVLDFSPQFGITGSFDNSSGVLTLSGMAKLAEYEIILQSVTYQNTSQNPDPATRDIEFSVTDFDATDPLGDNIPELTFAMDVIAVNDAPILSNSASSGVFTEGGAAVIIDNSIVISDVDNSDLVSATISITTNFTSTEDLLSFTDQSGITGSYNTATGELSLTGTASLAVYEVALQSVTYSNTSSEPNSATRSVDFAVDDGTELSNIVSNDISIEEVAEINIYNAISPNGRDGNDWWIIIGISTPNTIHIYNRWGDLVKMLHDYNGSPNVPNNKFDDLPSATYFYKISSAEGDFTGYLVIKK